MDIRSFLKSKKDIEAEPKITLKEHKSVVNEMLGSVVQMNVIVAQWSKDVVEAADKSHNQAVIQFAKSSLLSLKKMLAESLQKTV